VNYGSRNDCRGASAPSKLLPCAAVAANGGDNERHEEFRTSGTTLSIKIAHETFSHLAQATCTRITNLRYHIIHNAAFLGACEHLADPFL